MFDARKFWKSDLVLRIAGVALLASCWLLMRWLFGSRDVQQHHDPSVGEFAAAAAGFLCFSVGSALTTLGAHIFDQIEISERWTMRSHARPLREGDGNPPACLPIPDLELSGAFAPRSINSQGWGTSGSWSGSGGSR